MFREEDHNNAANYNFDSPNALDFDLAFSFKELYFGDVDEGDYRDAVTVRFELDL